MRKLLLLLLILVSVIAEARKISESEAATIASEFLNSAAVKQTPANAKVRRAKALASQMPRPPHFTYTIPTTTTVSL